MLSEVWKLVGAIAKAGIPLPLVHPRVHCPGRTTGECLRVRLGSQGDVAAVELVTDDEWGGLWTIRKGKQNSFPVVRAKEPILAVPADNPLWRQLGFDDKGRRPSKATETQRVAVLRAALSELQVHLTKSAKSLWKRLRDMSAKELAGCAAGDDPESRVLLALARRFQQAAQDPDVLLAKIAHVAVRGLEESRLDACDAVETLVFGKGPPGRNGKAPAMAIQLAFDVDDSSEQWARLYSSAVRARVAGILPGRICKSGGRSAMSAGAVVAPSACALTGEEGPLQEDAFPTVKFPVLNKEFPLVSMFSEAKCNRRYGLTDSRVVPVSVDASLRMKASLEWVLDDSREGKTWRGVASGKFEKKKEKKDLLVVYVDGNPKIDANVAAFFGAGEGAGRGHLEEKQFEVDASAVCAALSGIEKEQPGSRLNLFLLRRASEGQAHVVLAETPTVREILDAAARWQAAVRDNLPVITLPLPPKAKGEEALEGRPLAPYPEQVVQLLSQEWVRGGTRANKVQGVGLGDVLTLMLRTTGRWETAALHMLDLGVRRLGPLLLGVFGVQDPSKAKCWKPYPPSARIVALRGVSLLGILLDALGRHREDYVMGTAFQVGRLLSLADTLHREYCRHVRGGAIPPQLVGNALMPVAADNPEGAVDRLRERMGIYKAWATQAEGKESTLAKWSVAQMGQACHLLAQAVLPTKTDQAFRAELFLGYMARETKVKVDVQPTQGDIQ